MNKNYYEILEVDQKASNEIIDKAYKTLVKKYHPDLQNTEKQKEYEEKMKLINEAYSVLSDDYQRATYDEQLQKEIISKQDYQKVLEENRNLKQELRDLLQDRTNIGRQTNQAYQQANNQQYKKQAQQRYNQQYQQQYHQSYQQQYQQQINRAVNQAYQDAYVQDMKNRGYKIKYKHTFKQYKNLIIAIICVILVCILLFQIPPIKKFFVNIYEENIIIKSIVDIFINTFTTKF